MPIRPFLLVRQAKRVGYAYRARSVEAIRLCRKMEQDLGARYGGFKDGVHHGPNRQPRTVQNIGFPQPEDNYETILKAVWEAVHSACATPGKNTDTENAFERLFGLLRRHGNKDFVEALEQAKRKDENTIELFAHFSAKYDSYKPIIFNKTQDHLFSIRHGRQKTNFHLEVDYPPQVHALAWRLKKRCSSALPLRHPHFYPHLFIRDLTEDLIGRPLGFLGGQTYGLKPLWSPGWTPRIEVYGDDPTGLNFKLDSGGFSSTFRSTIELPDPKRVIFRDIFGQLLTQNAMENVITAVGNTKEITYSVWDDGRLRSEVRTLGEIAEAPFLYRKEFPTPAPLPQESRKPPSIPSRQTGPQPKSIPSFVNTPEKSAPPPRAPPTGRNEGTGRVITFPRFAPKGPKGKSLAKGIMAVSANPASLLPTTLRTFPETEVNSEKESWVHKHIVSPVKKMFSEERDYM